MRNGLNSHNKGIQRDYTRYNERWIYKDWNDEEINEKRKKNKKKTCRR